MLCGMLAWLSGSAAHRRQAQQLTRTGLQHVYEGQYDRGQRHLIEASLKDSQNLDAAWGRLWLAIHSNRRQKANQIVNLLMQSHDPNIERHIYAMILLDGLKWSQREAYNPGYTMLSCRLKCLVQSNDFVTPRWFEPTDIWPFIVFQAESLGQTTCRCATLVNNSR
ncbi:MAG: hypothetical protein CMH53_00855 [Myxococcales bacterium]|nr:hypothetical protein [Myxococcales bacterium]